TVSNMTATSQIYTLSLHDALPICDPGQQRDERRDGCARVDQRLELAQHLAAADPDGTDLGDPRPARRTAGGLQVDHDELDVGQRSEEHTSELQSRGHLVCRLLLEK